MWCHHGDKRKLGIPFDRGQVELKKKKVDNTVEEIQATKGSEAKAKNFCDESNKMKNPRGIRF